MQLKDVLESLTIDDIEKVEDYIGAPIESLETAMTDDTKPKARTLRAVAWMIRRPGNPDLTFEECGSITLAEVSTIMDGEASRPNPTTVAG